jgi:hypothetical protein
MRSELKTVKNKGPTLQINYNMPLFNKNWSFYLIKTERNNSAILSSVKHFLIHLESHKLTHELTIQ